MSRTTTQRKKRTTANGGAEIRISDTPKRAGKTATLQFGSVSMKVKLGSDHERATNVGLGQAALRKMKRKLTKPGVRLPTKPGVPLFFADPANPRRIVRELDGRRETGFFENGEFKVLA